MSGSESQMPPQEGPDSRQAEALLGMVHPPDNFAPDALDGAENAIVRQVVARRWQSALESIPTTLDRLVFLAGLKDPESDLYRHFGLELGLGTEQAHAMIAAAHGRVFASWLATALVDQKAGIDLMLGRISPNRRHALSVWRRRDLQLQLVPPGAADHERALFLDDMEVVTRIIEAGWNGNCPDAETVVAPPLGSALLGSS